MICHNSNRRLPVLLPQHSVPQRFGYSPLFRFPYECGLSLTQLMCVSWQSAVQQQRTLTYGTVYTTEPQYE